MRRFGSGSRPNALLRDLARHSTLRELNEANKENIPPGVELEKVEFKGAAQAGLSENKIC